MPNSFFIRAISRRLLSKENAAALMHPQTIAGMSFFKSTLPCLHRKIVAITADGIKNNRLMLRATGCAMLRTSVSHSISRLPPPTPIPDRKPSRPPISIINGILSSIDTAPHPIESGFPTVGATRQ